MENRLIPLDEIYPMLPEGATPENIEAALRVCKVRRDIMERLCAADEYRAQIIRQESVVMESEEELARDDLKDWQKRSLEGRLWEAKARIESARQQIIQGQYEVQVLQAALRPSPMGRNTVEDVTVAATLCSRLIKGVSKFFWWQYEKQ